jgi:hypothetical protein
MKLIFQNIKGTSGHYDLGRKVIITGTNSAGKSAILDAITLASIGYHPELGKSGPASFHLASGNEMWVVMDGDEVKWKKDSSGKVSFKASRPPCISPHMISLHEFFGATRQQRMELLLKAGAAKSGAEVVDELYQDVMKVTPDSKSDEVRKLRSRFSEDPSEFVSECLKMLSEELNEAKAAVRAAKTAISEATMNYVPSEFRDRTDELKQKQAQLNLIMNEVNAKRAEYNAQMRLVTQARAAIEGVTLDDERYAKAKIWAVRDGEVKAMTEKLKNLNAAVAEAQGSHSGARSSVEHLGRQHSDIVKRIANLKGKMESCPTCGASHEGWRENAIEMFQRDLAEVIAKKEEADQKSQDAQTVLQALSKERDELEAKLNTWSGSVAKAKAYVAGYETQKAEMSSHQAVIDKAAGILIPDERIEDRQRIEGEIGQLEVEQRNFVAQIKAEAEMGILRDRVGLTEERKNTIEAARSKVQEIHDSFLATVVNETTAHANLLVEQVLGKPLTFDGYVFKVGEAHINTLSGSEKLVVHAGIQMALTRTSPLRIMLMDELGRCDLVRKGKLLKAIDNLIEKNVIRHFVGVDVTPQPLDDSWQIIDVSTASN